MNAIWEPQQYLKFADARLRPAVDLLSHVEVTDPCRVFDLGCGTGNVTRLLRSRWPRAQLTGIDNSATMLAEAAREESEIDWVEHDLATWQPNSPADLIFSNAALHWLPHHDELFPQLMTFLSPGGCLAIQMPRNFAAPSHTLIAETVRACTWWSKVEDLLRPAPVEAPPYYYHLLAPLADSVTIWETEYLQVLQGADPVKEWVKGTWLKPLLDRLDPSQGAAFEKDYALRLNAAYPASTSGVTLFPFKRLFILAQRK